ncbi:hypothetical protein LEP1GSC116_4234 [Leptospira interrogans serovar Icterohaemorrhagiae str. Verdun HP]|uniref:Uncharacterized protein n=1 Tax=Leptospira interrogans serovar Icterohaemorrhagiae str. Verdun HP TaxID=1049910 RepID=M6RC32_LEPIR|nr:hypothetical protein LEP1GSC080_0513 [Leptospira interrogans str. FPW2026]EMO05145.1 hypothetical protein LEP1GSC116_4234 [Leptospira interrogans serovar Icterohaemorrhagiae str. Verdun HP]
MFSGNYFFQICGNYCGNFFNKNPSLSYRKADKKRCNLWELPTICKCDLLY